MDLSSLIASSFLDDPTCDDGGSCDPNTPFRTMTGHCNNLGNPSWGKSLTTFTRLLPSVYDDGISRPRVVGATGQPLPSPRIVSSVIHPDISNLHSRYTLITMQFAQFLDHDLTMTPIHKGKLKFHSGLKPNIHYFTENTRRVLPINYFCFIYRFPRIYTKLQVV